MATALLGLIPSILSLLGKGKVGGRRRSTKLLDGRSKGRKHTRSRGRGLVASGYVAAGKVGGRKRSGRKPRGRGGSNPWLTYLKAYHRRHPHLSYSEAMSAASREYNR